MPPTDTALPMLQTGTEWLDFAARSKLGRDDFVSALSGNAVADGTPSLASNFIKLQALGFPGGLGLRVPNYPRFPSGPERPSFVKWGLPPTLQLRPQLSSLA